MAGRISVRTAGGLRAFAAGGAGVRALGSAMVRLADCTFADDSLAGLARERGATVQAAGFTAGLGIAGRGRGRQDEPGGADRGAHAACYSMALSHILAENDTPPDRLHVTATCRATKDAAGLRITGMHLDVRGKVSGLDAAGYADAAAKAAEGCPVSQLLGRGLEITHAAVLDS